MHEFKTFTTKDALTNNVITWLFEEDSFSPIAKIKNNKHYSIVNDHLGTPIEGYDDTGTLIWERQLNANGKIITQKGVENFCPFLYQGQTLDNEIELAYNRFRYYDVEDGRYISQDPIGLHSGELNFYAYVEDINLWVDSYGLAPTIYSRINKMKKAMTSDEKSRTTFSVARVKLKNGKKEIWVSSAGKKGYVPPRIRKAAGTEKVIKNKSALGDSTNRLNDAEQTILREANSQGATVEQIGATRDMCQACQNAFSGQLNSVVTPLKP